ncbi:MAG: large-conductance mechanosensitive channel protein MscL [Mucinivorans sp.]
MKTPLDTLKPLKGNKFINEFKQFALRGNVVDMAVGIIIGAAFGKIVSSLVGDILMPPIGFLIGDVEFTNLRIALRQPDVAAGIEGVFINYGNFIQVVFDFLITAFAIFMAIKFMMRLRNTPAPEPTPEAKKPVEVPPTKEEVLLTEIRDLLKKQQ